MKMLTESKKAKTSVEKEVIVCTDWSSLLKHKIFDCYGLKYIITMTSCGDASTLPELIYALQCNVSRDGTLFCGDNMTYYVSFLQGVTSLVDVTWYTKVVMPLLSNHFDTNGVDMTISTESPLEGGYDDDPFRDMADDDDKDKLLFADEKEDNEEDYSNYYEEKAHRARLYKEYQAFWD